MFKYNLRLRQHVQSVMHILFRVLLKWRRFYKYFGGIGVQTSLFSMSMYNKCIVNIEFIGKLYN